MPPSIDNYDNEFGRLDYNVGNNDKLFFDFRHNNRLQNKNDLLGNGVTGSTLTRENYGVSLDDSPYVQWQLRFGHSL